ncbi:DNA-binding transcriptional MerR regulator [Kribbella italica]|uniref:DNA-binding transcriptional MerR regulator n=1 Tax=Kribbella italica TaxID=1540520 RepID=A0A7W9J695_9ACTN|nr:DNA-binding transcriptional MerR regulator [Kribbella italica]
MTLRSWERRYGVGPSGRSVGGHRRYNRLDVERLQRMRNLIAAGTPAREAAGRSVSATSSTEHDGPELWTELEARYLVDLASASRTQSLADELHVCLAQRGLSSVWDQVVRPALRLLEDQYLAAADCSDIELVLTQAVSESVDRHVDSVRPRAGDAANPVLLVCCPGERHHLPLKVLQGVLLDQAIPTIVLGPGLAADAAAAAISRIAPSVVVLWAVVRRRELMGFHRTVVASEFVCCAAGPGWPRTTRPVTSLEGAAAEISGLWLSATSKSSSFRP